MNRFTYLIGFPLLEDSIRLEMIVMLPILERWLLTAGTMDR